MDDKAHEKDLAKLNADLAKAREEIAALAASLEKLAACKNEKCSGEHERSGFQHKLEAVGAGGGKVAQGLAEEIERHPLIGGVAAFGVGFVIAMMLFKRS